MAKGVIGQPSSIAWRAAFCFAVALLHEGDAFVARIKLVSQQNEVRGERTLRTTGPCAELVPSLGLTISLAIDPMAGTRTGPPEGAPPSERPVEPATPVAPPDDAPPALAPAEEPAPPLPVRWPFGGGILGSLGIAPSASIGGVLFVAGRVGDAGAGADGGGGSRTVAIDDPTARGGLFVYLHRGLSDDIVVQLELEQPRRMLMRDVGASALSAFYVAIP